jgi:hypothetical protein
MYCPQCGQQRISEATSFCSRCGYLLTGTADLMRTGGAIQAPAPGGPRSPRSRGIRMGLFMFLLTFVIAPVVGMLTAFGLGMDPWPVGVVIFLLGVGGILRIIYALMFESKDPYTGFQNAPSALPSPHTTALPPQREMPAADYASPGSAWREPEIPDSVTDNTTKLLEKEGR